MARKGASTMPDYEMKDHYDFSKGRRGAVVSVKPGKVKISIRLDEDVINWFKDYVDEAGGGNYQTLMNTALREWIESRGQKGDQDLLSRIRDVIREELAAIR